jgi:adenylate cyclase
MGADEEGMLERLKALRSELVDPKIAAHHGRRIVKTTGDGMLIEFPSVVDAVRCAVEVQRAMPERNADAAPDNRIELCIGINPGEVIVEGDDLYGDPVNIAAQVEALADAGGVFVSNTVHEDVRDRLPFVFEDLASSSSKTLPACRAPGWRNLLNHSDRRTALDQSETNVTTKPWSAVEWIADADLTSALFY